MKQLKVQAILQISAITVAVASDDLVQEVELDEQRSYWMAEEAIRGTLTGTDIASYLVNEDQKELKAKTKWVLAEANKEKTLLEVQVKKIDPAEKELKAQIRLVLQAIQDTSAIIEKQIKELQDLERDEVAREIDIDTIHHTMIGTLEKEQQERLNRVASHIPEKVVALLEDIKRCINECKGSDSEDV